MSTLRALAIQKFKQATQLIGVGSAREVSTFRETSVLADPIDRREWESWHARRERYSMSWSLYENTVYSKHRPQSLQVRQAYSLYAHVRSIFSPANHIVEWHATNLWGGSLDPEAGDGEKVQSALPILTKNEAIRKPIASIWKASRLQEEKTVLCRFGAAMGDVAMVLNDDPDREKIYIEIVPASSIKHVERNYRGEIIGYMREELRPDPNISYTDFTNAPPYVTYTETCYKAGNSVEFRTFKNGEPFDWRLYDVGDEVIGSSWTAPYPFVPLVMIQHIHVGFDYGWDECHALLSRIHEINDLGSITTDQGRKQLNGAWAINTRKPSDLVNNKARPTASEIDAIRQTNVPGRDMIQLKYFDQENLKLIHMVGELNLRDVGEHTKAIRDMIDREFPEVMLDTPITGDPSGRAYRLLRGRAETKARHRRVSYDQGLVHAHKMGIIMGAMRGYPDFSGFSVFDWETDKLDHRIDPERSVLATDPMDEVEYNQAFWNAAIAATTAGCPLEIYLEGVGWSKEKIAVLTKLNEAKQQSAMDAQRLSGQQPGGNPPKPKGSPLAPPTNIEIQKGDGSKGNPSLPADGKKPNA